MRYLRFYIEQYRGISKRLAVDLDKFRLLPIIGVNECGKTTMLEAITAFDFCNDDTNDGRHLDDVENLYSYEQSTPRVSAEIEVTWSEFNGLLKRVVKAVYDAAEKKKQPEATALPPDWVHKSAASYRRKKKLFTNTLLIQRDLKSKTYSIDHPHFSDGRLNTWLANEVVRQLPYTLYFDDFRHQIPHKIPLHEEGEWLEILKVLFEETDPSFNVLELSKAEARKRKGIIAKVEQKLNDTLTKQWQRFNLDNKDALSISITYDEKKDGDKVLPFLLLEIVETDAKGQKRFFYIKNRSKGFFWFFNFVMRLEFNPKSTDDDHGQGTIYLLDEPGSYLHAAAQRRLCEKLRDLSRQNTVVYCTHSHHLLDPQVIPIGNVHIADKDANGSISLTRIFNHKSDLRASAFQPIQDALQIRPSVLDVSSGRVLVTEGMYDYFCFDVLLADDDCHVVPAAGADSCRYLISLLIGWRADYRVLWDNDKKGQEAHGEAREFFGVEEAQRRFRLLPLVTPRSRKRILQDLFDGADMLMLREALDLPKNSSFEKTILAWYYSSVRDSLKQKISAVTQQNFQVAWETIWKTNPTTIVGQPGDDERQPA